MTASNGSTETLEAVLKGRPVALPEVLPLLPLEQFVLYPFMIVPIMLTDETKQRLVDEALVGDRLVACVARKPVAASGATDEKQETGVAPIKEEASDPLAPFYAVGTAAVVLRMLKMPDGSIRLLLHGLNRIRVVGVAASEAYLKVKVQPIEELPADDKEVRAMIKNAQNTLQKVAAQSNLPEDLAVAAANLSDAGKISDLIASNLSLKIPEQQEVLEEASTRARLQKVMVYLNREMEMLEIGTKIQTQIKGEIEKNQRDYILREQLKAIRKELGEDEGGRVELEELRQALEKKAMPDNAREVAKKELERLRQMQPASAEYTVSRTYLGWILDLPWADKTGDNIDLKDAARILNEDHYDLDKIKERILEYLAVVRLRKTLHGPILCLVGAPGVGKTSLGRSIARTMGRKFYRMSLGGHARRGGDSGTPADLHRGDAGTGYQGLEGMRVE
ncbi:MAG: LON peptidase substrate-binding domain-containing protein [bacterium]